MGDINGGDIIQLSVSLSTVDTHSHHYQLFPYHSTRNNVEQVLKKKMGLAVALSHLELGTSSALFLCLFFRCVVCVA